MKTHKVRPVLVESKEYSVIHKFGDCLDIHAELQKWHGDAKPIYQELILISLEDEKIEVGDSFWYRNYKLMTCTGLSKSGQVLTNNKVAKHNDYGQPQSLCKKVIATQSQLSPEYIQQFIEEYNKGEVKDIRIEWQTDWCKETIMCMEGYGDNPERFPYKPQPKLTNDFVTIVEKEPITYTEDEVRSFVFKAYNLRTFDGVVRSTNSLIDWFEHNKKK